MLSPEEFAALEAQIRNPTSEPKLGPKSVTVGSTVVIDFESGAMDVIHEFEKNFAKQMEALYVKEMTAKMGGLFEAQEKEASKAAYDQASKVAKLYADTYSYTYGFGEPDQTPAKKHGKGSGNLKPKKGQAEYTKWHKWK